MNNETKRDVFEEFADECAGLNDEIYNQYMQRYDTALPDDLPVIPKAIAEYIEHMKSCQRDIGEAIRYWLRTSDIDEYMEYNSEKFARAWLDGYQVEEDE